MTTPTLLPPGVTRNSEPCWVLVYADGKPYESHEGVPHFDDADEAQGFVDSVLVDDEDPLVELPKPEVLSDLCHFVTTFCGYTLDEDEDGISHFTTANEAFDTAMSFGWRMVGDGFGCPGDNECPECDEAVSRRKQERGPVLLPVPVAEGQEPLIEVIALEAS